MRMSGSLRSHARARPGHPDKGGTAVALLGGMAGTSPAMTGKGGVI